MKIGILTFHNADNYGAVLQCYALQEHLKKLFPSEEVCVIDHKNPLIEKSYRVFPFSWNGKRSVLGNILRFGYWCVMVPERMKAKSGFVSFRKNALCVGSDLFSDYDIIFYGSDQIWNKTIVGDDEAFFGKHYDGKKIAYAASDGGELILDDCTVEALKSFKIISCREKSLSEKLLAHGIKAETVSDPVFLLSKAEWDFFSQKPRKKGYVLAYQMISRSDFDSEAVKLGKKLGKKVIQIFYVRSLKQFFIRGEKKLSALTPEQFVGYFANAEFVLTTSFHGTAFSILFEKPFYVLSFEKRSERITDLLHSFGLENRFVQSLPEDIAGEIYTQSVREKISDYRLKSKEFIALCAKNIGGGYKCIVILSFAPLSASYCASSSWRCAA